MTSLGEQFRRLRLQYGLQLDELSELTGIPVERLQTLESGEQEAWLEEAIHLARAYGMTIDEMAARILGWTHR